MTTENTKDPFNNENSETKLKPLTYWRDMLDHEIMGAVWRGQRTGLGGGIQLTNLAQERLQELLSTGHSGIVRKNENKK